jgi:RHS repeat-associated protein
MMEGSKAFAGTLLKATVPLPGGATAIYSGTSGMPYIRHLDWLGSARLSTTWSHTVQSKVAYAPFGETYNEAGASSNDRSFTGQDQDTVQGNAATGIYDFLFRKYDPAAGRWLSPDPSGWGATNQAHPQSLDRYAYVQNDPMRLTDQIGLDCLYFDNQGVSVESIDHNTNSGECAQNGGDWVNGTVPSADWATYNPDTDTWNVTSMDPRTDSFYYSVLGAPGPQVDNIPCYGDCTMGYSATSLSFVSNQVVAGSVSGFAQWISQAQVPLSTAWRIILGGKRGLNNYCGPNGAGVPLGGNDWACALHDYNYFSIGAGASSNFDPFFQNGAQLQVANQNLVNNVDHSPEGIAIQAYFRGIGLYPARYSF